MADEKNNVSQGGLFGTKTPAMPEECYSGDKPNQNLRNFVEEHLKEHPYNPENDDYDVQAFDKPIETTKATAIYNMHTYWSKKPHGAIREYIRHYTGPGDLVLDPFCGSGGTALVALMESRKAIAIDRSPAATFITKNYCTPVDVEGLQRALEELKRKVKHEIDWLYETRCDRCGGKATTAYMVYSQVFQCPRCLEKVALFDCTEVEVVTAVGKPKKINACPYCHKKGVLEEISTRAEKFGAVPVLVSYVCESGCRPARGERRHNDSNVNKRQCFETSDIGKLNEIDKKEIPYWYPRDRMMHAPEDQECWGVKWRAGTSNFRRVNELFTKRNLWALAALRQNIQKDDHLLLAFNAVVLNSSKLYRHRSGGGGGTTGNYYIAQDHREMPVWPQFIEKIGEYLKIGEDFLPEIMISTQSAVDLSNTGSSSVDYIFTDPPYAEKVQYGELNFVWEAWLGFDTHWHNEEIIVNDVRGKTERDWADMMRAAMAECYRVLKPGRWISLCYHDTSEGTWALVQDIMSEAGFLIDKSDRALFIDTGQKSYNQQTADKVNKRDLVINFQKPKPKAIGASITLAGHEGDKTFGDKVRKIIGEYLTVHSGATKDHIYDEVVSRMVRSGQMEAHNFEELLRQVADEVREPIRKDLFRSEDPNLFGTHEIGRWYLKEKELIKTDEAETSREDTAAEKIASFMKGRLQERPEDQGVHYSDLFEQYVYTVRDKPRRQLADWLPDYFYKTEEGTWRLPLSVEEEQLKKEGRAKGTNRRIKHYLAMLDQGIPIPEHGRPTSATLVEWIRHSKRSGLYEQGKMLYERGGLNLDALSEDQLINVEEDYQTCIRLLSRSLKK